MESKPRLVSRPIEFAQAQTPTSPTQAPITTTPNPTDDHTNCPTTTDDAHSNCPQGDDSTTNTCPNVIESEGAAVCQQSDHTQNDCQTGVGSHGGMMGNGHSMMGQYGGMMGGWFGGM